MTGEEHLKMQQLNSTRGWFAGVWLGSCPEDPAPPGYIWLRVDTNISDSPSAQMWRLADEKQHLERLAK